MINAHTKLFVQSDLDAEPYCADETGDDHGDDGLEGITLCLLDALTPAPQVLKVRANLGADPLHDPDGKRIEAGQENISSQIYRA